MRCSISTALVQIATVFALVATPAIAVALPRSGCVIHTGHIALDEAVGKPAWIGTVQTVVTKWTTQYFVPVADSRNAGLFQYNSCDLAHTEGFQIAYVSNATAGAPPIYLGAGLQVLGSSDNANLDDHWVSGAVLLPVEQVPSRSTTPVTATWSTSYTTAAESQVWSFDMATQKIVPQWANADGTITKGVLSQGAVEFAGFLPLLITTKFKSGTDDHPTFSPRFVATN